MAAEIATLPCVHFLAAMACRKARICAELRKNVHKGFFCNKLFSDPPPPFRMSLIHLVDISAPNKKYLAPPPQIPQFPADTLPTPQPLLLLETPPPGIFNRNRPLLGLALPPSRAEKIKNLRNVHQVQGSSKYQDSRGPPRPDIFRAAKPAEACL